MTKKCYIIAGPNGAGKTTFATEFLPIEAECLNFINADLIAKGKQSMKEYNKYSLLGLQALKRAKAKVAQAAKKNNYRIPVWKNDKIEYEIPEIFTEHESRAENKKEPP